MLSYRIESALQRSAVVNSRFSNRIYFASNRKSITLIAVLLIHTYLPLNNLTYTVADITHFDA